MGITHIQIRLRYVSKSDSKLLSSREILGNTSFMCDEKIVSKAGILSKISKDKFVKAPYRKGFDLHLFYFVKNVFARATNFLTTFSRIGSSCSTLGFLFPHPNCFRTVFVPTSFTNVLSFLRPLTISPISGAAFSNKSAPILFAAGIYVF